MAGQGEEDAANATGAFVQSQKPLAAQAVVQQEAEQHQAAENFNLTVRHAQVSRPAACDRSCECSCDNYCDC